jgi:hypothetical protein
MTSVASSMVAGIVSGITMSSLTAISIISSGMISGSYGIGWSGPTGVGSSSMGISSGTKGVGSSGLGGPAGQDSSIALCMLSILSLIFINDDSEI